MSLLTVEVEIINGVVTPKEPHLLPAQGVGYLTILTETPVEFLSSAKRERVRLPLIHGQSGTVINPTKEELDASLWD